MTSDRSSGAEPIILYLGGFELPDRNAAAQRVIANAMIYRELGYRVILLGVTRDRGEVGRATRTEHDGVPFECWETRAASSQLEWLRYITSTRPARDVLDAIGDAPLRAIICYNHPAVAQYRLIRLAHAHKAALIADVTEWYSRVRGGGVAGVIKNTDVWLRMHGANRRADGLITTSPYLTEFYRQRGAKTVELPTLMPSPPVSPAPASAGPKRIFFAGTGFDPKLVKRSGGSLKDRLDLAIDLLSGAARRGADFRLDAYGVTKEDYLALRPDHQEVLGDLDSRVAFHGRQPRSAILDQLASADFSIFFRDVSRVTLAGFPTKYAESIHYGTPVITNPMPNLATYHRDGQTGFLLDPRSDDAADALTDILKRPQSEVAAMKAFCATSGIFSPSSYAADVASFMDGL